MNVRKLHRTVGLIFAPFFLITGLSGAVLLWRSDGVYGRETKGLLLGFHNWEMAAAHVGVILAAALIAMVITGLVMLAQMHLRNRRRP